MAVGYRKMLFMGVCYLTMWIGLFRIPCEMEAISNKLISRAKFQAQVRNLDEPMFNFESTETGTSDDGFTNDLGEASDARDDQFAPPPAETFAPSPSEEAFEAPGSLSSTENKQSTMALNRFDDRFIQDSIPAESFGNTANSQTRSSSENFQDRGIFTKANSTIPGLAYLGTGYDIIFGNPIGDPKTMLDPGYKPPVVQLRWNRTKEGVSNDLRHLQPLQGWVRDEVACRRAEEVESINSVSDYRNSLSVDATVSGNAMIYPVSFSASTGYKSTARSIAKKNKRSFMMRTYCNRYVAGLDPTPTIWNLKAEFANAVFKLPQEFDGLRENATCSPDVFKLDENDPVCRHVVKPWMDFFKSRGTHVVDTVHL
ncbi:MAC/Perforin domain-containing protein, partial [Cardiosporidium cionae]